MGKNKKRQQQKGRSAGQQGGMTATQAPPREQKVTSPPAGEDVKLPISQTPKPEVPTAKTKTINDLSQLKEVVTAEKSAQGGVPRHERPGIDAPQGSGYDYKGVIVIQTNTGWIIRSGERQATLPNTAVPKGTTLIVGNVLYFTEGADNKFGAKVAKFEIQSDNSVEELIEEMNAEASLFEVSAYNETNLRAAIAALPGTTEQKYAAFIGESNVVKFPFGKNTVYVLVKNAGTTADVNDSTNSDNQ